jgi:hypothetical protein
MPQRGTQADKAGLSGERVTTCAERNAMRFTVNVGYDETERRYYVIDSDIPGLHVETAPKSV